MNRILLIVLLAILGVLLVPGLRQRAQPRIDDAREWLGQRLEGPLSPVTVPYRSLKTQSRIDDAVRILVRERNRGTPAPQPDDFVEFLRRHDIEPMDGWGAPLLLVQEPDSVVILSAGPDLEYRTADDLTKKVRYRAPDRFRFPRRR